jgi:hypothetical protein
MLSQISSITSSRFLTLKFRIFSIGTLIGSFSTRTAFSGKRLYA